jgi:hypothetical protein
LVEVTINELNGSIYLKENDSYCIVFQYFSDPGVLAH